MRFMIADTFQKSLGMLDPRDQDLVKRAAFDFQMNPALVSTASTRCATSACGRFA
jgi:hypothetical protein